MWLLACIDQAESGSEGTHIDVKISIVNVEAVGGLLEVDVGNTIVSNVVVADYTEGGTRHSLLHELGGSVDVVDARSAHNAGLSLDISRGRL